MATQLNVFRLINHPHSPAANFAQNAVMGEGFPHGLGRSSHWRECYGEAGRGVNLSLSAMCFPVLHYAQFLGPWGYFSSVNRWAMTAFGHHGTVRLGEHGNQSSS